MIASYEESKTFAIKLGESMKTFYYNELFNSLDNLFNTTWTTTSTSTYRPTILEEKDDVYVTSILIAGVKKENISINYKKKENYYNVIVDIKEDSDYVPKGARVFHTPLSVDIKSINATIDNGVLTITIKKDLSKSEDGSVEIK
jgi:HSP20 family molecular chaperone IbpA